LNIYPSIEDCIPGAWAGDEKKLTFIILVRQVVDELPLTIWVEIKDRVAARRVPGRIANVSLSKRYRVKIDDLIRIVEPSSILGPPFCPGNNARCMTQPLILWSEELKE
jgi:hypothetical protein